MGKSYNAAPSYNQPRRGVELLHGNEILRKLATERLYMLAEAKQRAETAANTIIAMHGVMPSAEQPMQRSVSSNAVMARERFDVPHQVVQPTDQPEQSTAPSNVIHAENRFGSYDQAPTVTSSSEATQQPEGSFDAPGVDESRATLDKIFREIDQARQEWSDAA